MRLEELARAAEDAACAGTIKRDRAFWWMSIDALAGVIAVSLVVVLFCHLCPPPDGGSGPGGDAP